LIISNQVRTLQDNIEQAKYDIGSKRKSAALDKLSKAKAVITNAKSVNSMLTACGPSHQATCQSVVDAMKTTQLPKLQQALQDSLTYSNGSDQERAALDQAYLLQTQLAKSVSALEENMVPTNYHTPVPDKFADLPQLQGGRATVEMVLQKPKSTTRPFTVNSQVSNTAKLVMVIDGYTAPVTSGNFVDLVQKGFYNNMPIQRSDGFVVQTGDPEGEAVGYTGGTPSKALGAGPHGERLIPNEVMVRGDTAPFYETTLEDEGRGGQAVVLPFSAYGAMGWARDEYEANSGSSQFFWLLFESDLTPAGKNVLDGRYPWYVNVYVCVKQPSDKCNAQ
jgi:cyclophilin family peptidyl-prolyl cis-trans isomerase